MLFSSTSLLQMSPQPLTLVREISRSHFHVDTAVRTSSSTADLKDLLLATTSASQRHMLIGSEQAPPAAPLMLLFSTMLHMLTQETELLSLALPLVLTPFPEQLPPLCDCKLLQGNSINFPSSTPVNSAVLLWRARHL